jgi:hypothetical protein
MTEKVGVIEAFATADFQAHRGASGKLHEARRSRWSWSDHHGIEQDHREAMTAALDLIGREGAAMIAVS